MAGIKHTCMQRCENRHHAAQPAVGTGAWITVNKDFLTWYLTVSTAFRQSEVMQKIRVK